MASCVWNILTKNHQNLIIGFQVTVENVGDAFWGHSVFRHLKHVLHVHVRHFDNLLLTDHGRKKHKNNTIHFRVLDCTQLWQLLQWTTNC